MFVPLNKKMTVYVTVPLLLVAVLASEIRVVEAPTSPEFTFAAAGDIGNIFDDGSDGKNTLNRLVTANPNFFIALGDLRYGSRTTLEWCNEFTSRFPNLVIIAGNHDTGESNPGETNYENFVNDCGVPSFLQSNWVGSGHGCNPTRDPITAPSCYGREFYFDYSVGSTKARIILVSPGVNKITGPGSSAWDYSSTSQHYAWMKDRIDEAKNDPAKPWIIVAMHKNCVSTATKPCEVGFDLWNLLVDKKVDMVLQAHDHTYQRSKQLRLDTGLCSAFVSNGNNRPTFNNGCIVDHGDPNNCTGANCWFARGQGIVLGITGTAGQGLYSIDSSSNVHEHDYFRTEDLMGDNTSPANNHGFTKYEVWKSKLAGSTNMDGAFSDSFEIRALEGDVNFDCAVNVDDLALVGTSFGRLEGQPGFNSDADLYKDSAINIDDLASVGARFGRVCS